MGVPEKGPLPQLSLPPGFRFYPTDEELLVQYLCRKVAGQSFSLQIIGEIDLYKFDPWVLPSKAIFGEKEWYFFSPRDRKYPNGSRPNRVAGSGYWKATGTDKIITSDGRKVGIKKALVFYVGKAPRGTKTNWIMHEYRLLESSRKNGSSKLDEWVLCRIYKKNSSSDKQAAPNFATKEQSNWSSSSSSSHLDDVLDSLPEIDDQFLCSLPRMNSLKVEPNLGSGNFDWASLGELNSVPELGPVGHNQAQAQAPIQDHGTATPVFNGGDFRPEKFRSDVDEEVQSGFRTHRFDNSGLNQQFSNAVDKKLPDPEDSFLFRYPTQPSAFGFRL